VLTPLDVSFHLGANPAEATDFTTFVGQGARMLQGQPDGTVQAARASLQDFFKQHEGPSGINLPGALWLVSALV
jgi:hypothetical protein